MPFIGGFCCLVPRLSIQFHKGKVVVTSNKQIDSFPVSSSNKHILSYTVEKRIWHFFMALMHSTIQDTHEALTVIHMLDAQM